MIELRSSIEATRASARAIAALASVIVCLSAAPTHAQDGRVHPELWPAARSPVGLDEKMEARITDLLNRMTLRQKVGQVIQADIGSITPDDLRQYPLGSILNGGNSAPGGNNRAPAKDWLALADAFYQASRECDLEGGPFIPLLWGTDAVHGHNNIVGATFFPHNIGLGATRNPDLLRKIGQVTAKEIRVTGQEWTFAPTIAVVRDDRWGRTYEGYSENPEVTTSYVGPLIEGIQGKPGEATFLQGPHVIATAKHYLGDGGTLNGKDQGDNVMSEADLRDLQGAGYPVAISHGVQCIMASFSSWQGKKIHGHKGLLTDVLKKRMGFDGFVVGDWNAHGQVPGCTPTDAVPVLHAGLDMFMAPDSWKGLFENLLRRARAGEVDMDRLNDAVRRILRVKLRAKLFDAGPPSSRPFAGAFQELGKPEHRAVARQAVRESLVLLKNNGSVLPLDSRSTIVVAGDGADNIGKQCGGWSLSWQGTGNANRDFPGGTSIFEGIRRQVEAAGGRAVLAVDGKTDVPPDAAIVVFGEDPYAEFQGDVATLAYKPGDDTDLKLLKRFHDRGIPTVAVFLSGRPLWVNREFNASDAFVAAWLPGSEGIGVADVLLRGADGRVQHDFKGKLPYSWPRTPTQTPLNVGDKNYDPLFAYGYGLTYTDSVEVAALLESTETAAGSSSSRLFAKGRPVPPWKLVLSSADNRIEINTTRGATPDGVIKIVSVDDTAQEDARQVTWNGRGTASVVLRADAPVDLSAAVSSSGNLRLRLRLDGRPTKPVTLSVASATKTQPFSLNDLLDAATPGQWREILVPLSRLAPPEGWKAVTAPLILSTGGRLTLGLSTVELVSPDEAAIDWHQRIPSSLFVKMAEHEWISPVVEPPFSFEELIYSWHLDRPGDTFRLYLKVVFDKDDESDWLYAGYWGNGLDLTAGRTTPTFSRGVLDMDWLKLTAKATGFRFKIVGGGVQPPSAPPALTVITTDNHPSAEIARQFGAKPIQQPPAPRVLDVPLRRQFTSQGERLIDRCQSAALASAMEYFGRAVPMEDIIKYTFDEEYGYPGIWPRVIAAAQEFGFDSYIERFRGWDQVRRALAENKVILCSMTMKKGDCEAPPYPSMSAHIVALCGLTDDGRVVVTDSFLGKSGAGYLCQWLQRDFEKVWMKTKGGIAMVICPPEGAVEKLAENLPPFPQNRSFPAGDAH